MTITYNQGTSTRIQRLFTSICERLGITTMKWDSSAGFVMRLGVNPDGQSLTVQAHPDGAGNSNPFGSNGATTSALLIYGDTIKASFNSVDDGDGVPATLVAGVKADVALASTADDLLLVTAANNSQPSGPVLATRVSDALVSVEELFAPLVTTATLVAGVKADVALANAVGDQLSVELATTGGTVASHFSVVRVSDTLVKVQAHDAAGALVATNTSTVQVFNFKAKTTVVQGTLVAGTADLTLASTAADRLVVQEVVTGGAAADHFSVHRHDATTVTVQAHDAAGALVATNTSTVQVFNFGLLPRDTTKTTALKVYNLGEMI